MSIVENLLYNSRESADNDNKFHRTKDKSTVDGYIRNVKQNIPMIINDLCIKFYHIDEQWEFTQDIMQLNTNMKKISRKWCRSNPATFVGRRPMMSARKSSDFDNTAYGKCVIDSTFKGSIIWKLQWKIKWNQDFAVGIASVPSNPPPTNICFGFDELNDTNIKWYSFMNHNSQTTFICHDMQWNLENETIDDYNDGAYWKDDDILVLTLKLTEISQSNTLCFHRERNGNVERK
eukprot:200812_1